MDFDQKWLCFIGLPLFFHSGYRKNTYIYLSLYAILMITKHLKGKKP